MWIWLESSNITEPYKSKTDPLITVKGRVESETEILISLLTHTRQFVSPPRKFDPKWKFAWLVWSLLCNAWAQLGKLLKIWIYCIYKRISNSASLWYQLYDTLCMLCQLLTMTWKQQSKPKSKRVLHTYFWPVGARYPFFLSLGIKCLSWLKGRTVLTTHYPITLNSDILCSSLLTRQQFWMMYQKRNANVCSQ